MVDWVYALSLFASTWLGRVADFLPLGYAFGAGMVAAVNPCGFAMLPAYLGLYLGRREEDFAQAATGTRYARALVVAASVTAGFVLLFGLTGLVIAAGGRVIVGVFPWMGLLTGALLAGLGLWLLSGRSFYSEAAGNLAEHLSSPGRNGIRGFFSFGLAYGIASLSCTLPIFLSVVGSAIAVQGVLSGVTQFVSYALGMGLIIVVLTLALAAFKGAAVTLLRRTLPYFNAVTGGLILLAGVYIVYYWLTVGGLWQVLFA